VTLGLQCRAEAPQRVLPRVSIESRRAKRQLAEACQTMLPRALVEIQGGGVEQRQVVINWGSPADAVEGVG
jgi:hypothetical protein